MEIRFVEDSAKILHNLCENFLILVIICYGNKEYLEIWYNNIKL